MSASPTVFLAVASPELQEVAVHVRQTLGALGCLVTEGSGGYHACAAAIFLVGGDAEARAKAEEGMRHPLPGIKVCSILVPHPERLEEEQEPAPATGLAEGFHEVRMWKELDVILADLAEELMRRRGGKCGLIGLAAAGAAGLLAAVQMTHWGRH